MKDAEIKESIFLPQTLKCGFNLRFTENDSYQRYENDENGKCKKVLPQHTNIQPQARRRMQQRYPGQASILHKWCHIHFLSDTG